MASQGYDFHSPQPLIEQDDQGNRTRDNSVKPSIVNSVLKHVADTGSSLVSLLSGLLAAALILFAGYVLYDTFYTQERAKSSWDLLQFKPAILEMGDSDVPGAVQNKLGEINPDYRAWLTVYDTNIDYPVMQGPDDLYYATHDIYKEVSLTGAIYLAAGNHEDLSDSYNLIYGHHMDNKAMFGGLDLYGTKDQAGKEIVAVDQAYFDAHRQGILVGRTAIYDLNAFALAKTDAYQGMIYTGLDGSDKMNSVLDFLRANLEDGDPAADAWSDDTTTLFMDEAALTDATKIVALSTCAAANTNGRLVVFYTATQRNLITVEAQGGTWVYDGEPHGVTNVTTNYPGDDEYPTTVEYSIDDGATWTTTPPQVTHVSESTDVIVRVTNDVYGRATTTVRLEITPKAVTVTADAGQQKTYGQGDPVLTATVTGLVGNDSIAYSVTRPGAGTDEDAGTYPDAVVPAGDARQDDYTVTYVPADFTIVPSSTLRVSATGYEGVFDGQSHAVSARANVTENTVVEYSTDGGRTWTTTPPARRDVGSQTVQVRATNPNYVTATATVPLRVTPKAVTVRANAASKVFGAGDPAFTATVTGLVGNDTIAYTLSRPNAGTDEAAGTYPNAIVPAGEARQGNYTVTYTAADFTITPADALALTVSDYTGVYDGKSHTVSAVPSVTTGTIVEYSTDNGATWTTTPPSITDVGSETVQVRATNPNYEPATATYTLTVTPAPVTVRADNSGKTYGQPDPDAFTATVTGLIGEDTVEYTVSRPGAGTDEDAGTYSGAIVPAGQARQGNYAVTYINGDFEIAPADGLTLRATGFTGVYDGQTHAVQATATAPFPADDEDTVIEYSTDGGVTWTRTPPSIIDVGEQTVQVRATNPNYEPATATVRLRITPRQVTVTVGNYSKLSGSDDPAFSATVEGLLDGDEIAYTISREPGEAPASYTITPAGQARQGNYTVVYRTGRLRIINRPVTPGATATPAPTPDPDATPDPNATPGPIDIPDPEVIDDPEPPFARVVKVFEPKGAAGRPVWALVNLICLILTIYLFLPLLHLQAKFGRGRLMRKINRNKGQLRLLENLSEDEMRDKERLNQLVQEARQQAPAGANGADVQAEEFDAAVETLFYRVKKFLRRFRIGLVLELIFAALALIAFILTEDMRLPMVLIDKWTPLMIVLLLIEWILDVRLIRYREKVLADEEEAQRLREEREAAAAQ